MSMQTGPPHPCPEQHNYCPLSGRKAFLISGDGNQSSSGHLSIIPKYWPPGEGILHRPNSVKDQIFSEPKFVWVTDE